MKRSLTFYISTFVVFVFAAVGCASNKAIPARGLPPMAAAKPADQKTVVSRGQQAKVFEVPSNRKEAPAVTKPGNEQVQKLFDDAKTSMKNEDWVTAELKLLRLVEIEKNYAAAYASLGIVSLKLGKYAQAEDALQSAVKLNVKKPEVYNLLAVSLRQRGKFKDAEKTYLSAIELDKTYSLAYYNLAVLYDLYLSDFENAKRYYQQYLQLKPSEEKQINAWLLDMQKRSQAAN